jgi:hypothetical protein
MWAETKKTIINYSLLKLKIMTTNKFKIIAIAVVCAIGAVSCNNDDNNGDAMVSADFQGLCTTRSNGETSYKHCFIASGQPKDDFNAAIPSAMGAITIFNLDY